MEWCSNLNIAIIPARGGSKRIPRKNIRAFHGKPIIAYAIETAIKSNLFDRIIVSTEDLEIAEISRSFGAEVPRLRSDLLSDDYTTTLDVMASEVAELRETQKNETKVCCIYPATPLLQSSFLAGGLAKIENDKWDYVVSAVRNEFNIFRSFKASESSAIEMIHPEFESTRSQDLPDTYQDAGQFYWGSFDSWLKKLPIFSSKTTLLEIPNELVVDIDQESDWLAAEKRYLDLQNKTRGI